MINKIKAMLIEEILVLIFNIFSGLFLNEYETESMVLISMVIFSAFVVIGKIIEIVMDYTVFRKIDRRRRLNRILRFAACFVLISAAYFGVFCFKFFHGATYGALIMFAVLGLGLALIHLVISSFIDRTVDHISELPKDYIFHCFTPVEDEDEEDLNQTPDGHHAPDR